MKTINSIAIVLFLALTLGGCSNTMTFQDSSVVPAASGEVKVKKDKNSNYDITVSVANLAEPKKLTPSRDVYLVWMDSDRNTTKKLGQIKVGSGMFSKALTGELSVTEAEKPKRVFITAENSEDTMSPSTQVVLTTGR